MCNLCLSPDHRKADCDACKSFRSKKTFGDQRARRLERSRRSDDDTPNIFSEEHAQEELESEEEDGAFSVEEISCSNVEGELEHTLPLGQRVSTIAPNPAPMKEFQILLDGPGRPLPSGHG